MTHIHSIPIAGTALQADLYGALAWPAEETLVFADLHLEKGSSFAARGRPQFVPPYDTRATLERMERLIARYAPRRVICLGDSVHDRQAAARIAKADAERIAAMTHSCDWIWVAGNHDPEPPDGWGGTILSEVAIGNIVFRHEAAEAPPDSGTAEISGHFHPTASVPTRAARVRGRCFVSDARRLMMPAFGAYAGGLNVLDPAIARLFGETFDVAVLGHSRVYALNSTRLRAA
jgi:DNA ligase-associated metallophosphoesterase